MQRRKKMLIVLSALLLSGPIVAGIALHFFIFKPIQQGTQERIQQQHHNLWAESMDALEEGYQNMLQATEKKAIETAVLYADLPEIKQAYRTAHQGDITDEYDPFGQEARVMIRSELAPTLKNYKKNNGTPLKLHYHLPNAHSLVRLWRDGYQTKRQGKKVDISDDISTFRNTILTMKTKKSPFSGIEIGRGGFAIRGLAPIIDNDGSYLGSNEILYSYNAVAQSLLKEGVQLAVYMHKSHLSTAEKLQNTTKYPLLGDFVQVLNSNPDIINASVQSDLLTKAFLEPMEQTADKQYLRAFAINDFSGKAIGVMVLSRDISQQIAEYHNAITSMQDEIFSHYTFLGIIALIGVLILIPLLIRYVGVETGKAEHWYRQILDAIDAPISVSDSSMKIMLVNKESRNILDRKHKKDIIGVKNCDLWKEYINPELCPVNSYARTGNSETKAHFNGKDYKVIVADLYSYEGQKAGYLEYFLDISAHEHMRTLFEEVNQSAQILGNITEKIRNQAQGLSDSSNQQASALTEITQSISQLDTQTHQNAEKSQDASSIAIASNKEAQNGSQKMSQMTESMQAINTAAANIQKILKVIDDIAFQTNLLALNAAVEAARAGEHGKGFAVVAEEVRNLAARSAQAAQETATLIEEAIRQVKGGTSIADDTAGALNRITEEIAKTTELMEFVSSASQEQAKSVAEINQGVHDVESATHQNTSIAQETFQLSAEMQQRMASLLQMMDNLHHFDDDTNTLKTISASQPALLEGGVKALPGS